MNSNSAISTPTSRNPKELNIAFIKRPTKVTRPLFLPPAILFYLILFLLTHFARSLQASLLSLYTQRHSLPVCSPTLRCPPFRPIPPPFRDDENAMK